jgi:putative PEP-CTERM system histidine kinase
MISSIELVSYSTAAVLFLLLSVMLTAGQRGILEKSLLAVAAFASALWATAIAFRVELFSHNATALALELLRDLAWFAFLLKMLANLYDERSDIAKRLGYALPAAALVAVITLGAGLYTRDWVPAGHLLLAVGGLVLVEQILRNAPSATRRSVKYLCIGVGSMFVYDFYLYADALLLQQLDSTLWTARGFAHGLAVPLLLVALARRMPWRPHHGTTSELFLSRRVAFHTSALLLAGIYLLIMGAGGYYVRLHGGTWGLVAQTIFLFGAVLMLVVLLFSGQLRARIKVLLTKHFFHYKYDYREEWLRFIRTLSSGDAETQLRERAIQSIAQIVESPGGILWMRTDPNRFEPVARYHMDVEVPASEPADSQLVRFLEQREWVINMDEHMGTAACARHPVKLPKWLTNKALHAWLVVPLILHERLYGFVVLARCPLKTQHRQFNWEDCDLLKIAGRQAASHIAQLEASRALSDARQFEAFNRLSAYVVHDVKNLVAQLSLLVTNATRHKHNPLFIEDMIRTVDNSVGRMNRLLAHLRGDGAQQDGNREVDLSQLLLELSDLNGEITPATMIECDNPGLVVNANPDRLASVIGHVIQNARDATPNDGRITVRLRRDERYAIVEVEDNGCGMDEAFIRDRLFRPFDTTKGASGMGVGAYETREYVRSLGGHVDVASQPGKGTRFRLHIPYHRINPQGAVSHTLNA